MDYRHVFREQKDDFRFVQRLFAVKWADGVVSNELRSSRREAELSARKVNEWLAKRGLPTKNFVVVEMFLMKNVGE